MIIAVINTKLRHPVRRIIQHESDQSINGLSHHSESLLMVIYIHGIPTEAQGLVIEGPLGDHTVAVGCNVGVDLFEGVTEHFDDGGTHAVAGLAAVEVVDL